MKNDTRNDEAVRALVDESRRAADRGDLQAAVIALAAAVGRLQDAVARLEQKRGVTA